MTNASRIKEIIEAMPSFCKKAYRKEELLPEYLELQKELINLTFNDSHAENGKLRIWDVENHLQKLNDECGHPVDLELDTFKDGCKFICNAIKSEFSGNAGEYKAFRSLETLRCKNKLLRNVELRSADRRTEIDALVFTENAVFVIEVKNPHLDIYIDERGNYCRVGNTMNFDCNLGEKMNDKVFLLKEAFKSSGLADVDIVSLVVFTNSTIHVDNRYEYIDTCFLSSLPHIIDNYKGSKTYSDSEVATLIKIVENAECKEEYPLAFDVAQFKLDFATLMVKLETFSEQRFDSKADETPIKDEELFAHDRPEIEPAEKDNSISKRVAGGVFKVVEMLVFFGAGFAVSQVVKSIKH